MKKEILCCFLLFSWFSGVAQWIKGEVADCKSLQKIPNVFINFGEYQTTTNQKGVFFIPKDKIEKISQDISVVISAKNYEKIEEKWQKNQSLTFYLCPEKIIDVQEVVVTAMRSERSSKNLPIITQVIAQKQIEKTKFTDFKDFLENQLSGISFTNEGGFPVINMGGFSAKYLLFLIDGQPIAGETMDTVDFNRINMNQIQRIEIIKGAASAIYGANAVGGVINIITKNPKKEIEGAVHTHFGSFQEQNHGLFVGGVQPFGNFSLAVNYKNKMPYSLSDKTPQTQVYQSGRVVALPLVENFNVAGYTDVSFYPKAIFKITDAFHLNLLSNYYFKERNLGTLQSQKVGEYYYGYGSTLKGDYRINSSEKISFSVSYDQYDKVNHYKIRSEKEKKYQNDMFRAMGMYEFQVLKKHFFSLGAEYASDALLGNRFGADEVYRKKKSENYAIFAQQEWKVTPKITAVTGLRFDAHKNYKQATTLRMLASYHLNESQQLKGGYSGGFRAPTLKELYTDWFHPWGGGFQIIGNEQMKVEKSHNFNVSWQNTQPKWQTLIQANYSTIQNKIQLEWLASDKIQYRNIARAELLNLEFSGSYRPLETLELKADYSFVKNFNKEEIVRPHRVSFQVYYQPFFQKKYAPTFTLSGKYTSAMRVFSNQNRSGELDVISAEKENYYVDYQGYTTFRGVVNVTIGKHCNVFMGADNILNYTTNFTSFYSNITPGRTFFAGGKITF